MLATRLSIALFCFTAAATAQLPGPGLTWIGVQGGSAGSFIPSCTDLPVPAYRGDSVTLRTWGDQNALYVLFAAGSTMPMCMPFPGIGNGLMLNMPVITVAVGTLTQVTPCLSCPPGLEPITFTVPAALLPGTSISFQAASYGAGNPSFTVAITATVQ